jgi:NitT/TauT family transport system permease protein
VSDFAAGVPTVTTRGGQSSQLRKFLGNKWTLRALSLAVLLGLWQVFGNKFSTSFPTDIARTMPHSLWNDVFPAFGDTFKGFFTGYAVCILAGIPIGLLMARSRLMELILEPYIVALYATPRLALIPVLILWFGIDFKMRFMVVLVSGFFPIVLNTWLGAKEVDQNLLDAGRAFNAGALRTMRTIVIPATLPYIFAGLRLGMARALIGIIVAEIETSVLGIGNLISTDVRSLRFADMWVAIIALGVFSILFTVVLKSIEQWATVPWQRKGRFRLWPSHA